MGEFRTRQPELWDDAPWGELGLPAQISSDLEIIDPDEPGIADPSDGQSDDKPKQVDWS